MAFVREYRGKRGRVFYVRYVDETGRQVELSTKAKTKTEAARMGEDLERRAERVRLGLEDAVEVLLFSELWARYKPVAQTKRSWDAIRGRFEKHLLPAFGDRLVHQIRAGDVEALLASKLRTEANPKGLSEQTCEHLRIHVAAIYTFAIRKLRVFKGENPGRVAQRMEIPEAEPRFFPVEMVAVLIQHVPDRWRGMFATAVYTGLRKGELVGLRVANVDMVRRAIVVSRSYAGTTKAARVRHVPIPDELLPYLKVELGRVRSEWLFPARDGKMLTRDVKLIPILRRALRKGGFVQGFDHICRTRGKGKGCGAVERRADDARGPCPRCGRLMEARGVPMKATFKDLRSTFATHLTEATGDLRVTQRILGHSDPKVTERRYAHARDRHLLEQANRVSFAPTDLLPRQVPAEETGKNENSPNRAEVVRLGAAANPSKTQR